MELKFDLLAIVQRLEDTPEGNDQFLSELLFFPEFQTFGNSQSAIRLAQQRLAQAIIQQLPSDQIGRRSVPAEAEKETLELSIASPTRGLAWEEPVTLELPVLIWDEGDFAKIGYLPTLGIEVVANNAKKLPAMLESHAEFELKRRRLNRSLMYLAMISRVRRLQLTRIKWQTEIKSPAARIKKVPPKKQRVLSKVGTKIGIAGRPHAYCRDEQVEQLARLLGGRHPTCVLIVGESGVGKTAITMELARRRGKFGLLSRPFWRTSGSRIVAGQTGFGMWQDRCTKIIAEAKDTGSILCFGNLHELMQVGQSVANSDSIASFLRAAMIRSDLLAIAECTPGQLAAIEARDPRILDAFRRVTLEEPPPGVAREILGHINSEVLAKHPKLDPEALLKLDSLHRRYMTYSAFPGRPARFLRGLRAEASDDLPIDTAAVTSAFSKESGLPALMLDEEAPFVHAEILDWFKSRVHAQDLAVKLVVDRLSIVKAQLSRPKQPLASFLFAGPTGVGKTELAKTLAEFLYGSKDRLLRLDMSEYGTPGAASRLVSNSFEQSEGILTSKVRDQPFSVILFDEFEKAHASLFDLLLQVLGEGRLTDASGRLADFSNSVIIMTSNLGAESFSKPALGFAEEGSGGGGVKPDAYQHFLEAVKDRFRPEFFNRIDRVIPFAPLDQSAIRTIALREIELASARDGLGGKRIVLHLSERCIDWLVANGYDPRYGARPLKRALEQRILLPVAELLNKSQRHGGQVSVDLEPGADIPHIDYQGEVATAARSEQVELGLEIDRASAIRRDYLRLQNSPLAAELESEKRRIEKQKDNAWRKAQKKRKKHAPDPKPPYLPGVEQRLADISQLLERLATEAEAATRFEERSLIDYYARSASAPPGLTDASDEKPDPVSASQFKSTLLEFCSAVRNDDDRITLTLLSEDTQWMFQLAKDYVEILKPKGGKFKFGVFRRKKHEKEYFDEKEGDLLAMPIDADEFDKLSRSFDRDIGALSIEFKAGHCGLLLANEDGLHQRVVDEHGRWSCLIETNTEGIEEIRVPLVDIERINLKNLPPRRHFDDVKQQWKDKLLQQWNYEFHRGTGVYSQVVLSEILDDTMYIRARAALGT